MRFRPRVSERDTVLSVTVEPDIGQQDESEKGWALQQRRVGGQSTGHVGGLLGCLQSERTATADH